VLYDRQQHDRLLYTFIRGKHGIYDREMNVNETQSLRNVVITADYRVCIKRRFTALLFSILIHVERKNQLDTTQWFIDLVISSTCFGHLYAHRQGLEIILRS
jgi:hypothetical protein